MPLKAQDIMVALKLCTYERKRPPMSVIAADLNMSPSEVHGAIKRLQKARLLHGPEMREKTKPLSSRGIPIARGEICIPSRTRPSDSWSPNFIRCSPLKNEISPGDELPPVWPWRDGETRGVALEPLYRTAPAAALRDPTLYDLLALVDAIRDGRARERKIAEKELVSRLRSDNVKAQSRTLELLTEAARLLKPLLAELVFVGGSTTALLVPDKAAAAVRPTYDVEAIAEISSYTAYADFSERLRQCGFIEDTSEGAPICRWRQNEEHFGCHAAR